MKPLIIYHRADDDGKMCREILLTNWPDADLCPWDYGDPVPDVTGHGRIIMADISIKEILEDRSLWPQLIWIDHHKTAIDQWDHPEIAGIRVDGVGACRLALGFVNGYDGLFKTVSKPILTPVNEVEEDNFGVFLIGLRDVWDHKKSPEFTEYAEHLHLGLIANQNHKALAQGMPGAREHAMDELIESGRSIEAYSNALHAEAAERAAYITELSGLRFLTLNTPLRGSALLDKFSRRESTADHDALMVWAHTGEGNVVVSLYHAENKELDLSKIAKAMGGGGHRGACGFRTTLAVIEMMKTHPAKR